MNWWCVPIPLQPMWACVNFRKECLFFFFTFPLSKRRVVRKNENAPSYKIKCHQINTWRVLCPTAYQITLTGCQFADLYFWMEFQCATLSCDLLNQIEYDLFRNAFTRHMNRLRFIDCHSNEAEEKTASRYVSIL